MELLGQKSLTMRICQERRMKKGWQKFWVLNVYDIPFDRLHLHRNKKRQILDRLASHESIITSGFGSQNNKSDICQPCILTKIKGLWVQGKWSRQRSNFIHTLTNGVTCIVPIRLYLKNSSLYLSAGYGFSHWHLLAEPAFIRCYYLSSPEPNNCLYYRKESAHV